MNSKKLARFLLPLTLLIMLSMLLLPSSHAKATEVASVDDALSLYSATGSPAVVAQINALNGPIESVSISGPTTGDINTAYSFTSTVSPESATTPIAHIWRTTDQSPVTHIGGLTNAVTYTWNTPGVKEIKVTVTGEGTAQTTHLITILPPPAPPTDVTLWGQTTAGTNNPVWVSAQIDPLTATVPITYTWEADGQSPITLVRDSTDGWDWSPNGGWSQDSASKSFTWDTVGPKVVTFTATNAGGTVTATHTITVSLSPTVALTGPTTGEINTDYTFTATVSPDSVATPINYSWEVTEQPYVWREGGISDTLSATWSTGGTKVLQVWVWNGAGWHQDAILFEIPVPLPPLTPTIQAVGSGDWDNPEIWSLGQVPTNEDVVLIPANLFVTASEPIEVESLINHGTLQGSGDGDLIINATEVLSNTGVIRGSDGTTSLASTSSIKGNGLAFPPRHGMLATNSNPACNLVVGTTGNSLSLTVPLVYNLGVIQADDGGDPAIVGNSADGGDVIISTTGALNNWDNILSQPGVICSGGGWDNPSGFGGNGGEINLTGSPVNNDGVIWAGDGGNGTNGGGKGGSTFVFGENTTNTGDIGAGNGGDTTANISGASGGDGGDTEVWGKYFTWTGFLVNIGNITAGDGGDGNPAAANPQNAGCGGNLTLMAAPNVFLTGGTHTAGVAGTPSAGGAACTGGSVWIDPVSISLSGSTTRIKGHDIFIYSGDDGQLDLRNLSDGAISATGSITIAVGNGGVVDLTGNAGRILQAAEQVNIYADEILLDPGVPLFALAGTNVITKPARILRNVSLVGPEQVTVEAGIPLTIPLRVENIGPVEDTYDLTVSNEAGWDLGELPAEVTVDGISISQMPLTVTPPQSAASGNVVKISATSQADPTVVAQLEITLRYEPEDHKAILALDPPTVTTGVGESFELPIVVHADTQDVDGAAAHLNFDTAYLEVVSITPGSDFSTVILNQFDNDSGELDFAAGSFNNFPSGSFTLATVTFRAKALTDESGTPVDFNLTFPRQSEATFDGVSVLSDTIGSTIFVTNASLTGAVTLQGRPAPPHPRWSVPLRVSFTIPGESSPAYSFTPTTDENGHFPLSGIAPGTYEVRVKHSHTLQNKQTVTLLGGDNGLIDFGTLREGDANDDNYVTLVDFSILVSTFAKCEDDAGYDARADFNGDGCVTLLDFSLLSTNFAQSGDHSAEGGSQQAPLGNASLIIDQPIIQASAGETYLVTVRLEADSPVDGAAAYIDFDQTLLKVNSIKSGEVFDLELQRQFDNQTGTIEFAAGTLESPLDGNFDLLLIELEAIGDGESPLLFQFDAPRSTEVTAGGQSVLTEYVDGSDSTTPTAIQVTHLATNGTAPSAWLALMLISLLVMGMVTVKWLVGSRMTIK